MSHAPIKFTGGVVIGDKKSFQKPFWCAAVHVNEKAAYSHSHKTVNDATTNNNIVKNGQGK